jgi:hypothetical protein
MMSAEVADDMMCCASCGIGENDDINLTKCTACKSVRYCSVKCQKEHKAQHKRYCKKRASHLRDEILFRKTESSYLGDCPICCLPLSIDPGKSTLMNCCSKLICNGCEYANIIREREKMDSKCPFCRHPAPKSLEQIKMNQMKRIEVNDPVAMCEMGVHRHVEGDYLNAFEYWTKAAELGDIKAHFSLSFLYQEEKGVAKDKKKQLYHLEKAAIGGHPDARYHLGCIEGKRCSHERATKHLMIADNLGHDGALAELKDGYAALLVSKEDFVSALRGHQAAVDATKSPQRDEAEAQRWRYY